MRCGVSFTNSEYNAAQALLDLQSNFQGPIHENSDRNETIEPAKILLNGFKASNVPQLPKIEPVAGKSGSSNTKKTRNVATETEDKYSLIKRLEWTISKQDETIKQLRKKIEEYEHVTRTVGGEVNDKSNKEDSRKMRMDDSSDDSTDSSGPGRDETSEIDHTNDSKNVHRNLTRADDMVPIGNGKTMIPRKVFQNINWNSYTSATRKLSTTVFTRRVLATHSLTGRPSPAFPNKAVKKQLNQTMVNDIVKTVAKRCCVAENLVRHCLTIKCADESKMLRNKENNKKKSKNRVHRENIPPESDSDGL